MAGSLALSELTDARTTTLALARRADDGDLRALLRQSIIPGAVRVAFTREPAYHAGDGLAGAVDFTVVARRQGRLVAIGRCSVNHHVRNGQVQRIGYLGELRVATGTPGAARMLRDGYAFLAEVTAQSSVDAYFTSITVDNDRARRVLEHGARFGLPAYRPLANLVTLVAPVSRAVRMAVPGEAAACREDEGAELTALLQRQALDAHLTLAWDVAQWAALARHGITPGDFRVVRRAGRIVAAAAVWDQRPFRQTVIDGYAGALHLARPLHNAVQVMRGRPGLPRPGSVLALGALLGASVADAADWPLLWRALEAQASATGLSWLSISRDARDPHLPMLQRLLQAREYHTTLYDVKWTDHAGRGDVWDTRVFRPEVGLL